MTCSRCSRQCSRCKRIERRNTNLGALTALVLIAGAVHPMLGVVAILVIAMGLAAAHRPNDERTPR